MENKTCRTCRWFKTDQDLPYPVCTLKEFHFTNDYTPCESYSPRASYSGGSSGGCYIATCVYGSYDCPPVWTLRRYRDDILAKTAVGRAFIKTYYAISPKLVKWFGNTSWFKKMWKAPLDRLVSRLNNSGIENTSYKDNE